MNVSEAIRTRRSVRQYAERAVDEGALGRVLEAGRLAPSARNVQEWRFVVVRDGAVRAQLAEAARGQRFVGEAPVVIAACATESDHIMSCGQLAYPIDLAIAVDHMTLQAVEEGLGTCWVGAFDEARVKKLLGIPAGIRVPILLALGHPADAPSAGPPRRKAIDQIVAWEKWS